MTNFDFNKLTKLPWWHWSRLFSPYFIWKEEKRRLKELSIFHPIGVVNYKTNFTDSTQVARHFAYLYENGLGERKFTLSTTFNDDLYYARKHIFYHSHIYPWKEGIISNNEILKYSTSKIS